jgi:hypothetical protein
VITVTRQGFRLDFDPLSGVCQLFTGKTWLLEHVRLRNPASCNALIEPMSLHLIVNITKYSSCYAPMTPSAQSHSQQPRSVVPSFASSSPFAS